MNSDPAAPEQIIKPDSPSEPAPTPPAVAPLPEPQPTVDPASTPVSSTPQPSPVVAESPGIPIQVSTGAPATQPVTPVAIQPQQDIPAVQPLPSDQQTVAAGLPPQAPSAKPKSKKPLFFVLGGVVLVLIAVSAVLVASSLASGKEVKTGKEYIEAVQSKDYAKVSELSDSGISDLGNKIEKTGGSEAENAFYKSFLHSASEDTAASKGTPSKVKVTKLGTGSDKFAVVVYKIGSDYGTVVESYEGSEPRVVELDAGQQTYSATKLKDDYKQYQDAITFISSMVDQIAKSSNGDNSKSLVNLFGDE